MPGHRPVPVAGLVEVKDTNRPGRDSQNLPQNQAKRFESEDAPDDRMISLDPPGCRGIRNDGRQLRRAVVADRRRKPFPKDRITLFRESLCQAIQGRATPNAGKSEIIARLAGLLLIEWNHTAPISFACIPGNVCPSLSAATVPQLGLTGN